jgi:CRP-like cAMP-binding protein
MDPRAVLKDVELFEGVTDDELQAIAKICQEQTFQAGDTITSQGERGDTLYLIHEGLVEVIRSATLTDPSPRAVINLGKGQLFGEMALVDHGPRSATVRALAKKTVVHVIRRDDFDKLCESNHHLGYIVMRNIAADLSFKLRHRHFVSR